MTFKTALEAISNSEVTLAKRRTIEHQQQVVRESLADIDLFEVKIGQKDVSEAQRLRSSSACSGLNLPRRPRPPSPISSGFYDYSQTPRKARSSDSVPNNQHVESRLGISGISNLPDGVIATNHGKVEWVVEKLVLKPRVTGITPATERRVQSAGDSLGRPGTSFSQTSALRQNSQPIRSSSRW
jgi:hypothetical protein